VIDAEKSTIRGHLIFQHDYIEYQNATMDHGLEEKRRFRSRVHFVNVLSEFGILLGK